jgi:Methane oxygenase PmoA
MWTGMCGGKKAAWVDYAGPVDGKLVGIAIFDSPKNPRHPTRWHARDYGLFAANPFCEHGMDETQPAGAGDFKLEAGKSVTFQYRIILHEGDAAQARIAARFAEYAGAAK